MDPETLADISEVVMQCQIACFYLLFSQCYGAHRNSCHKFMQWKVQRYIFPLLLKDSKWRFLHAAPTCYEPMLRRWWIYPKSGIHWDLYALTVWSDWMWKEKFRMTRDIFEMVVDELRPHLIRQDTRMRKALPVEKKVAIALYFLVNKGSYSTVATTFGVGKSTVYKAIVQVFQAMERFLLKKAVYLGDFRKTMASFEKMGFPQVIGAVDGCHINIIAPVRQGEQFFNRKQTYSVLLQAVCDHTGRFIDIVTGYAGSNHDAFVFRGSAIYNAMRAEVYVPGRPSMFIRNKMVGPLIIGDAAYPIKHFLMAPYKGHPDARQVVYNKALNRCRNVVERAFGRLKSRFRALTCNLEVDENMVGTIVSACVILHNIIESHGEVLRNAPQEPRRLTIDTSLLKTEAEETTEGLEIREALKEYLWERRSRRRNY